MRYHYIYVALLLALCSCGYDNRDKVAMAVLFSQDDPRRPFLSDQQFDDSAFSSALQGKFPVGTSKEDLKKFAGSLGGRCEDPYFHGMRCFIPESGGFCYETTIYIIVDLNNNAITKLSTSRQGAGC